MFTDVWYCVLIFSIAHIKLSIGIFFLKSSDFTVEFLNLSVTWPKMSCRKKMFSNLVYHGFISIQILCYFRFYFVIKTVLTFHSFVWSKCFLKFLGVLHRKVANCFYLLLGAMNFDKEKFILA